MTRQTYTDPRWKAVRQAVLARDGHRCKIQRPKCRGRATEVDHIVAVSDGGAPFDLDNLRAACKSCNIGARNERVAALAREARGVDPEPPTVREWKQGDPLPPWPSWREHLLDIGYDDPPPPGGWRPDHLPPGTPRPPAP